MQAPLKNFAYKKSLFLIFPILLLIVIATISYTLKIKIGDPTPIIKKSKQLCNTGGAFKFFGYYWIGDDIYLKCDCLGKTIDKSGGGLDNYWVECDGEISYSCYKLNVGMNWKKIPPSGPDGPEGGESYILSHSSKISCPPNHWMNISCKNDSDCSALGCELGAPYCDKELGCICH